MPFKYISESTTIAKQNLPWSIILLAIGISGIFYFLYKSKPLIYLVASSLLLFAGGWTGYKTYLLHQSKKYWEIEADEKFIRWNSPNETVDKSFDIATTQIDHILVESFENQPESQTIYTLKLGHGSIRLSSVSGINLPEFTRYLQSIGIERKDIVHETAKK